MLTLTNIDATLLPSLLSPVIKRHLRVEHDRDDELIRGYISSAIFELERYTNLSIHPARWSWTPSALSSCYTSWEAPKIPVRQVLDDQDAVVHTYDCPSLSDLSKKYIEDLTPDSVYQLVVGYDDVDCLPFSLISAIKLLTGTLYENREAVQFGSLTMIPDIRARLQTLWIPAV